MTEIDPVADAKAEPVKRFTPEQRLAAIRILREEKGFSWAEVAAWFEARNIEVGSISSLRVTMSRAKARERAEADQ